MPATATERAPRVPIELDVTCAHEGISVSALTQNLSQSGIYVLTLARPPLELDLQLSITLPGAAEPIQATARVVRHACPDPQHEPIGFGLEFTYLDRPAHDRLVAFIESALVEDSTLVH